MQDYQYELDEPWYFKNATLIAISIFAIIIPFIAVSLIPLLILKKRNIQRYREKIKGYSQEELQKIYNERDGIIHEARLKADDLEKDGNKYLEDAKSKANRLEAESKQRLEEISRRIEEKDILYEKIVKDATNDANQKVSEQMNKLDTINAEIEKKDFYMSEINRLKEEIEALDK